MDSKHNPEKTFLQGRGAQFHAPNRFEKQISSYENIDFLDEPWMDDTRTEFFIEHSKKIINKVSSPDIPAAYSINPYQGCEHGCIYCYARNTHEYWGFDAGLDFEQKIMIKENAPELFKKALQHPNYRPDGIMFSGNTDCYQPIERKKKITRQLLEIFFDYRHPVGIITKNALILRDKELLQEMAQLNLVSVNISLTTLNEKTRRAMEPRTATSMQRLKVIEALSNLGIPVNIMAAPIIPSINDHEIPALLKSAADAGALSAGYTIVRLNGAVSAIFEDWVSKVFPNSATKVLNQISECHGGQLNDSRFRTRMHGEGPIAISISNLFKMAKLRYFKGRSMPKLDYSLFRRPGPTQLNLFK